MNTEPHTEVQHHKPKHLAEKFESMIGIVMVGAIVLLAVGLVYGILTTGLRGQRRQRSSCRTSKDRSFWWHVLVWGPAFAGMSGLECGPSSSFPSRDAASGWPRHLPCATDQATND